MPEAALRLSCKQRKKRLLNKISFQFYDNVNDLLVDYGGDDVAAPGKYCGRIVAMDSSTTNTYTNTLRSG